MVLLFVSYFSLRYKRLLTYIENSIMGEIEVAPDELRNYSICICEEELIQKQALEQQLINITPNPQVIIISTKEQVLKPSKKINIDFTLVNEELWKLFQEYYSAGPCLPLFESKGRQCGIDTRDLEIIEQPYIYLQANEMILFVIQKGSFFEAFYQPVPKAYYLWEVQQLFGWNDQLMYNPQTRQEISAQTQVSKLQTNQIWVLNHQLVQFQQELEQISQDFQQLITDKTRSTGPSTKDSQSLSSFENPILVENPIEIITQQEIDDFKKLVENALSDKKQPIMKLSRTKILDNIGSILQYLENEMQCPQKKQQQIEEREERTNDELIDQDL
ncbi:hypothetical protein pb186bvf_006998 [Paramecium bursaria]